MPKASKTHSLRYIGIRDALLISAALVVLIGVLAYLHTDREKKSLSAVMESKALILSRAVSRDYIDAISRGDEARIHEQASQLTREEALEFAAVYGPDGSCLWHSHSNLKERKLPPDRIRALAGDTPFLLHFGAFRDTPVCEIVLPLAEKGERRGFLMVAYSTAGFHEDLRNTYYLLSVVGLLLMAAGVFWSWSTTGVLLRSLDPLITGVRKISGGDLSVHIPPSSPEEVAVLTQEFNAMVGNLKDSRAELDRYHSSLEDTIARTKRDLEEANQKLLHAEKLVAIGELAAGVAHEINNPMTSIRMLTQMLLDEAKEPAIKESLEDILAQSLRCQRIVKDLLAFARDRKLEYVSMDIEELLEGVLRSLARQELLDDIEIVRKFGSDASAEGDFEQIEEVFTNLILNAVESMDGKGKLTLESAEGGGEVKIFVADTGCGIPPENLDRIFDPFFTFTRSDRGTGLGLSISYGIVRQHGGNIVVESEPGRGSTFTVSLPRKRTGGQS